jgi:PRC-barrel domain
MNVRIGFAVIAVLSALWAGAAEGAAPGPDVAQGAPSATPAEPAQEKTQAAAVDNSPEAIMNRRFPQKVRVGDLIGLPMLDDNDVTLGHVERVVRTPDGKIKLIVGYSKWFGWFGRPVAVPIEVVAILGRQIASLDMPPAEYAAAPTWMAGGDVAVPADDIIRIAVTRR